MEINNALTLFIFPLSLGFYPAGKQSVALDIGTSSPGLGCI